MVKPPGRSHDRTGLPDGRPAEARLLRSVLLLLMDLRRSYDLLMMKVLSLLQDEDCELASAIVSSREAIWALLADPKTVATLQG